MNQRPQVLDLLLRVLQIGAAIVGVIVLIGITSGAESTNGFQQTFVPVAIFLLTSLALRIQSERLLLQIGVILTALSIALPLWLLLRWGVDFPHGLLLTVFAGVVTVTLIRGKYAWIWLGFLLSSVVAIGVFQSGQPVADSWKNYQVSAVDGVVFAALILVIFLVLARFHRQLREAVTQSEEHVEMLTRERELLLTRDLERSRTLSELHASRIEDLARFAEIGKQAQKLFHDLSGPLSSLATYLDTEAPGPARSATEAKLLAAKASAEQIEAYVREVHGTMRGQEVIGQVLLRPLAERVLAALAPLALERKVTCSVKGKGAVQGQVLALSRAIQNLAQNAIEAAEGHVEILVSSDGWTVSDDGPGIMSTRSRKQETGHGLGLLIVREILTEHGASMQVHSGKDQRGTRVVVTFP